MRVLILLFIPQDDASFLILCPNIDPRNSKHLDIQQNTILVHYIDDIMATGPGKQEIAILLNVFMINKLTYIYRHTVTYANIYICIYNT